MNGCGLGMMKGKLGLGYHVGKPQKTNPFMFQEGAT